MHIIGAGMAGLLAANMLRRHRPIVLEQAHHLPNNHSAILRFRSSIVGDTLGIPFKKVTMIKTVAPYINPVADALNYSYKCLGVYRSDRSIIAGTITADRFIAPEDFISRMAVDVDVRYSIKWLTNQSGDPVISTIPMPALMGLIGYDHNIDFNSKAGLNIRAKVPDCDAYVSVYCPDPMEPFSRVSITGDELIIECPRSLINLDTNTWLPVAARKVGIDARKLKNVTVTIQPYQKIQAIDDNERKRFIAWATDNHNIYSLGRFATWRPNVLLDDLVNDVRLIERWIEGKSNYDLLQHRVQAV